MIEQINYEGKNKVDVAIDRIRMFEPPDGYYVAISGGKDSDVIADLAKRAGVKYELWHNHTTADAPETVRYIRKYYPDINVDYPSTTMWRLIQKKLMPPTRRVRYCCEVLKEHGGDGRTKILGIRWDESARRANSWKMVQFCYKDQTKTVNPIIDWSEDDVWEYHKQYKLPHNPLYDEGFRRVGCVMCPMKSGKKMINDAERWPAYKKLYIQAFKKMLQARKEKGLDTTWETPEQVFDWWTSFD